MLTFWERNTPQVTTSTEPPTWQDSTGTLRCLIVSSVHKEICVWHPT
jgi:hypothetical protein